MRKKLIMSCMAITAFATCKSILDRRSYREHGQPH